MPKNTLTNLLITKQEMKAEREKLIEAMSQAVYGETFEIFHGESESVKIPSNVREAYFNLFSESSDKRTITRSQWLRGGQEFYAKSVTGADITLTYRPREIKLEVSRLSFNGKTTPEISEIGLFSTFQKNGVYMAHPVMETELKVGENFEYYAGFMADHVISRVLDGIQSSRVIPHIPIERLEALRGWKEQHRDIAVSYA